MTVEAPARRRPGRPRTPAATRFLPKVDRRGPTDCWPWRGATTKENIGSFRFSPERTMSAHGFAKLLDTGVECPAGAQPQHTCKTPQSSLCCNPAHIVYARPAAYVVTPRGEDNASCKLSDSQVRDIRRRAAAGDLQSELATEYGVTACYLWQLVHRRARADVT